MIKRIMNIRQTNKTKQSKVLESQILLPTFLQTRATSRRLRTAAAAQVQLPANDASLQLCIFLGWTNKPAVRARACVRTQTRTHRHTNTRTLLTRACARSRDCTIVKPPSTPDFASISLQLMHGPTLLPAVESRNSPHTHTLTSLLGLHRCEILLIIKTLHTHTHTHMFV